MSKHTLEQVLEHLINKEDEQASELLHRFFVAKGKSIYEELSSLDQQIEEEALEEEIGGSAQEDFQEEILDDSEELDDEMLFSEAEDDEQDEMAAEPSEEEATADLAMDVEAGDEEPAEEEQAEDAMVRVEDALEDLKAVFADLMSQVDGDVDGDGDHDMEDHEAESDEEFDALGESVSLDAVSAPSNTEGADNKKSPVSSGAKISSNGAAAVKVSGDAEKGSATPSSKEMSTGNVGTVPGNKKAPALKPVAAKKAE